MELLADKIRPTKLDDIIGQSHLVGKGKVLRNLVDNKKIFSLILFGNPGIGKTSIAYALVNELGVRYRFLNAVVNNKADFDQVIEEAKMYGELVIIVDEIHRMNKDKQDILLPYIENGTIILIGLTTSNPYYKINPAIRSRVQIFELHPLNKKEVIEGLNRTIERLPKIKIDKESIDKIATLSSSDPDAAVYYLGRLIAIGDLDIIYRRMTVVAYEDIGLANPSMGPKVRAAIEAAEMLGLPEARIPLADVVIELAMSPKSNSGIFAIDDALGLIEKGNTGEVPYWINSEMNPLYKYPHNYPKHWVEQQYLPDNIKNVKFYKPGNNKYETTLDNGIKEMKK